MASHVYKYVLNLNEKIQFGVREKTTKLSTTALLYSIKYDGIRCMSIDKFPYLVHYRVNEHTKIVSVEALFHTSRSPNIWYQRSAE